ncbi:MAG: M48 family metallopeptidase [Pseudomonadota bacterium]
MQHVPRQPDVEVNVSKTHPLLEAGTLVVALSLLFLLGALGLLFAVDLAVTVVSPTVEARLFSTWTPHDAKLLDEGEDPRLETVRAITARLAEQWPESPYDFQVGVLEMDAPNALAAPGGYILVTTGLLDEVVSENELAFVLGHEIGHFSNRDHLRALGRVLVLQLAIGALGNGSSGLGWSIATLTDRGFGRRQEQRADVFGLHLVHGAYGHVTDATRFFERIRERDGQGGLLETYASTHPLPQARIDALLALADEAGYARDREVIALPWSAVGAQSPD